MYAPQFSQSGRLPRMTRARVRQQLMAASVCLPLMAATWVVRADDTVQLDIPDCAGARGDDIARLVRLEPAAHGAELAAELRCSDEHALISVRDPRRSAPLQLSLPLEGTQREARARFLALAIAELLATSRLELESRATSPHPPPSAAAPAPRSYALWLGAGVTRAFAPALFAPMLQLAAAGRFGVFTLVADVDLDWAATTRAQADISARALSLALGPGIALGAGAWTWNAALTVRAGMVWLRGESQTTGVAGLALTRAWLAPEFQSALELALSQWLELRLALQLGYVATPLRGLDADGGSLLELRGVRGALVLGVGATL